MDNIRWKEICTWVFMFSAVYNVGETFKAKEMCSDQWLPSPPSGTCIKIFRELMTMSNARQICQNYGGDLAIILNYKMDLFLTDQYSSNETMRYFVGLNILNEDGRLQWLDYPDEVDFTRFGETQPNATKKCVTLNHGLEQTWGGEVCNHSNGFICERFSDCKNEKYGMLCAVNCSSTHCNGPNRTCNMRTGFCYNGCDVGYHGPKCNVHEENIRSFNAEQLFKPPPSSIFLDVFITVCYLIGVSAPCLLAIGLFTLKKWEDDAQKVYEEQTESEIRLLQSIKAMEGLSPTDGWEDFHATATV